MPTKRTTGESRYGRATGGDGAATATAAPVMASYRGDGRPTSRPPTSPQPATDGGVSNAEHTDSDRLRGGSGVER